ncbi:type I-MYXAN CRISPR-associated protein Cas6/Cmx6 [Rhodoferax sp. 4810]|uniref:Type I-MYXAN CRISPR-associated protein Cas6/Cmx6 n=1 Tax=Thiospirillum jenense TaxID=1653858 RepID=A0A839HAU6_9GAMM|nr:type I-MYXAN CRISPR-associated protein Cas6/Cmx6 [Thiospirillum jenense]MBB1073401.1 type I-MYXAN CRISPR-associated protein Cas6/Cmx6 [Rhodoferax jenense]MBB1125754.1 type I-MYXAN CRISPR-associated protein Cas6/Cmx6 [Thiospirillum jenense]
MTRYWQEPDELNTAQSTIAVVDVLFNLVGRSLPVDHVVELAQAILAHVPWLANEPCGGIHSIYVAGSQNGWERPGVNSNQPLMLSRRTKLIIRVPQTQVAILQAALAHQTLMIADLPLNIGDSKTRLLSNETTLFARAVVDEKLTTALKTSASPIIDQDETAFLDWAASALTALNIHIRKALCGKLAIIAQPNGEQLATRRLLLANLSRDEALRLQQYGLGMHRMLGCGLFLPHKGIAALAKPEG